MRIRASVKLAAAAALIVSLSPAAAVAASASTVTADISFGCGSVPTFVSSNDGSFTGQGVNIRSGPHTYCNPPFGLGFEGDTLKVWCIHFDGSGSGAWVYLNDRSTGIRGWSDAQFVTWSGSIPACT